MEDTYRNARYHELLNEGKVYPEPTKTMTADEVAEMIENGFLAHEEKIADIRYLTPSATILGEYLREHYRQIAKERARAVAEALVGVTIKR